MKFRPLGDQVIVRPIIETEPTTRGVIIPDTAQEKPQQGEVIAVGPGVLDVRGNLLQPGFKPGDRVLFGSYSGSVEIGGDEFVIMTQADVMAVVSSLPGDPFIKRPRKK